MAIPSLKKRYFYKVAANIVGFAVSFANASIIPRGLGPANYGDYNYILNIFRKAFECIDFRSSLWFFTELSKRAKDTFIISFYIRVTIVQFTALLIFALTCIYTPLSKTLFQNQGNLLILSIFTIASLIWIASICGRMFDAYAKTIYLERTNLISKSIGLVALLTLFFIGYVNIWTFIIYNILLNVGVLIALVVPCLRSSRLGDIIHLDREKVKSLTSSCIQYTSPLFVYVLITFIGDIFDRWILQRYGGSVEQGYFSLAYNLNNIFLVFIAALVPLLMREFSIEFQSKNTERMRYLFRRYIPLMYSVAAFFCVFCSLHSQTIAEILGGKSYSKGSLSLQIMFFYPIAQVYSNLSGSIVYATGKTRILRNVGIFTVIAGTFCTYIAVAPHAKFGLDLGATGLAIKLVAFEFIGNNLIFLAVAHLIGLNFWRYFLHQAGIVGILLFIGTSVNYLLKSVFSFSSASSLPLFFISGVLYTLIIGTAVFFFPNIFGLMKEDINKIALKIMKSRFLDNLSKKDH